MSLVAVTVSACPDATGTLTFAPVANASTPTTPVTIAVTVHDSGGTANGGQDTTVVSFTVAVTPLGGIAVAPAPLATLVYRAFTLWLPVFPALALLPQVRKLDRELPTVPHTARA